MLAEAYLPDLQSQSQSTDGAVLAVLGAKLALADSPDLREQSITVLGRAVDVGDNDPAVWQTVAWVYARNGDIGNATDALQQGVTSVGTGDQTLQGSLSRMKMVGAGALQDAYASAASPNGAQPLLDLYGSGSFISPLIEAWGREFPESSGFRTRQLWAASAPNDAQVCRLWGLALLKDGRYREALTTLQGCVTLAPGSADAHNALGEAFQASGQAAFAQLEFLRALGIDPNRAETLIEFGQSARGDRPDFAVAALVKATSITPNDADAWLALGDTGAESSVYGAQSMNAYQEVERLDPSRLTLDDSYAITLMNNQNYAAAESLLRGILRARPGDPQAEILLASVLFNTPSPERLSEAESLAMAAAQVDDHPPMQVSTLNAQISMAERKPQQAIEVLAPALASHPNYPASWRILAQAYAQVGNLGASKQATVSGEQSQSVIDELDRLKSQSAQLQFDLPYHRHLADLYTRLGDPSDAQKEKQKLLQLATDPSGCRNRYEETQALLRKLFGPVAEAQN
jgi:tetratricopeptide (TPR) repeat protein